MIIATLLVFSGLLLDDKLVVTPGQPPDRGEFNAAVCPPAITDANGNIKKAALPGGTKEQGGSPQDKDVDNDGKKDYFMGEWKFVKGDRDLTVQQWCISRGDDFIRSYISLDIQPSSKGKPIPGTGEHPGRVT